MKNIKNIKTFLKISSLTTGFFALPLGFSFLNPTLSKKTENYEILSKIENVNLTNLLMSQIMSQKSNESKTEQINYGVNRFDVFGSFSVDFIKSLKTHLENNLGKVVQVKFEEYISVVSIAHVKGIDNKQLFDLIEEFFKDNQKEYRKIYNFTTGIYYDEFKYVNNANKSVINKNSSDSRYHNSSFETQKENDSIFAFVGLDKETRFKHFNSFIDSKLNVGVLEGGVAETHSNAFEWNSKYGNGIWWRDMWFYTEKSSRHATQVSELITGKKGINPSLTVVSVQTDLEWNGLSSEMNYLIWYTNIVNNSWGLGYDDKKPIPEWMLTYNWASKYFDDLIFNNPELINVIAAGNAHSKKNDIFEIALSKNSIIVGATSEWNWENKASSSQVGNDLNYLSVVAPGGYYWFTDKTQYYDEDGNLRTGGYYNKGTSFSAPVITTIAGMLKQKYKTYFDLGSDSIIFKSALITGSRKPNGINLLYTNETGYGIPNYKKIEQAIQSLIILPKTDKSNDLSKNSRQVYLNKGDKIRASLAFLYNGTNDKTDIDFRIKDINGNIVASSNSSNKNVEVVEFVVPNSGFYRFEAYRYSENSNPVEVAITYVKENN
ncbi:hypothetical protein CO229_02665 [Mycoplasmopsis bovirhinis]|uniref:S8 family serine peptidase n=1 Tax=Mycoplasmopsis bovirhinis TaxID=29553 RepID=UPI000C059039|nr:S8 family serine peptidase [Mycoplasmopsis bovirhinis]ATO31001.1 hypothetical protein CO229_02665 [Mycoplasmopsis bovirhinis]